MDNTFNNIKAKYCMECGNKYVGFGYLCEICAKQKFDDPECL